MLRERRLIIQEDNKTQELNMGGLIRISQKGDFSETVKFLKYERRAVLLRHLMECGEEGVKALSSVTPKDTGKTAESWDYEITQEKDRYTVTFKNTNTNKYINIAVILQYGHATRNGGWVEGRDYINPAIQPIVDAIARRAWKDVSRT